ncbi:hypothetical protein A2W14_04135 [Candidatus Gottesmanbacteria bacterium RBG_16_37_8]|uniref:Antitoxin n=1 Tax=Candidatus Gottesmanbacteria bacterium RBG_16_37_8 TaxID=1798371 RepID=A0A1F5YPD9_9BACT|nr:MAG: hypothetical protein A2W14_04135 [Candidatus Gottesmanbacteria bacterium RBG_16_37_8]
MKYYELTKEEERILKEVESGEWKPVKNLQKVKREMTAVARNTLNKTRNINIRLSERTLSKLKAKAIEEGIPYQTLASSLLHKYVNR